MCEMNDYLICSKCQKETDVKKEDVPEMEWHQWKCSNCDGEFYGQEFINWIADRISPSTSEDSTGRFVLRELVQNADDVEAESIIFRFCEDALYVYNNGFGFRSNIENGPGDFDRISRVLAKPKEKEYYTSGNFGSGFQTVYLFTNYPEIHSHGKSFRYDPTIPKKISLDDDKKIPSPYRKNNEKKGVVFRFPWRTEENAIVNKDGRTIFEEKQIWRRWDYNARILLYDQLKEYLHDSLLCCQHLKSIRILWEIDDKKADYQVERDFALNYIGNNGKIGVVKEESGKGGLQSDDWQYNDSNDFRYLIGSGFVHDVTKKEPSIYTIVTEDDGNLNVELEYDAKFDQLLSYEDYYTYLRKKRAIKKSDIHILLPLFPWQSRTRDYERKAWSYSVVPLPKESGNNFTMTAHLFPKQTREDFELHQEDAKREWLEMVLLSAAKLYLDTYSDYIDVLHDIGFDNHSKQKMLLDYLPEPKLGKWINVSLDDEDVESQIQEDFFVQVFSKKILLYKDIWYSPFSYNPNKKGIESLNGIVVLPRDQNERWLLQRMRKVAFTEEFLNHHRFKELKEFSSYLEDKIKMTDERFVHVYNKFQEKIGKKDNLIYEYGPLDKDFIDKLISHCLLTNRTEQMRSISIIPNKKGEMCGPSKLKREPDGEYSILYDVIPSHLSPHQDFGHKVKEFIDPIKDPEDLLKGIKENKSTFENKIGLATKCYEWLDASRMKLPDNITEYPIVLDSKGHLQTINDVFWVPDNHHDIINDILGTLNNNTKLVSKQILSNFEDFICKKLRVEMLDYSIVLNMYASEIEGITDEKKELQSIIVEGILLGLENGVWNISDLNDMVKLSNLRFLPVSGILQSPRETCLGSVNDKELDHFLGSIDKHVQDVILSDDRFVDSLEEMHVGNLTTNPIGWIIDRIDKYAEKGANEKGVCYLAEEQHRLISRCLDILTNEQNLSQNPSIMEKKILPVAYQDSIALSTLPRWDQKSGERRLEKYERDWPWAMPDIDRLDSEAKPIWDSIKFICLHEDFRNAESELIKEFELERLIAPDGTPRALMMYFLLPRDEPDKCLFSDDFIRDFVQIELSKDDIEAIKKSFLHYLESYYRKTDHEREQKINRKDKKCLYGADGVWRSPADFAFKMDDDLEILGYYKLNDFFSEDNGWGKETLVNIGVVDKVEFEKIKGFIGKISDQERTPENERSILKILIISIEDELGSRDDWKELSDIEWMPTTDGKWRKPNDTVPPLIELEQILRFDAIDSIIDYTSLSGQEKSKISNFIKEQFDHIGFRTNPTFEEFIDVWDYCSQEDIAPPLNLFNELENNFNKWVDKFNEGLRDRKYFCDGKWVSPSKVVMDQVEKIPEPLRNMFSFTNEHENILRWLRGETDNDKPIIKVRDALGVFDDLSIDDKRAIWKFIVDRRAEIDETFEDDFKDKHIFPHMEDIYAPENIIVPSRGGKDLKFRGKLNNIYVLDDEQPLDDIDTLLKLGASELADVLNDTQELQNVLMHVTEERPQRGSKLWSDFVTLISILIEKEVALLNLNIIPIDNGHEIYYELPENVLIKDENDIWTLFKDEQRLNFFDRKIFSDDDIAVEQLIQWFKCCGANDFKKLLESEEPTKMDAEYIPDLTDRFRTALQNLMEIEINKFEYDDQLKITQLINNLIESSIYSCEDIIRHYCIDMRHIDGGPPITKKVRNDYYFDRATGTFFIHKDIEDPIDFIKEKIKVDFNPGFDDIYRRKFWEEAVESVFNEGYGPTTYTSTNEVREIPDLESNLEILDEWWGEYNSKNTNRSSFPTLDGDFWWSALGIDDQGDESKRDSLLKERLFNDRKLMFNIFAMATFLGANVGRTHIKNYINLLDSKGLSLCQIYDMDEENAIRKMIDDILKNINSESLQEKHYPDLRRRFFDILLLRRAMKDEYIGENIIEMLKIHMEDGLSPETFLTSGQGYGNRPFMKGFKGMFTGQIYFIIRETVRLGLAENWKAIAFHAPSQVRTLIEDLGGDVPQLSNEGWREDLAISLINEIENYKNLKGWYDIPFFMYYDEFCRNCKSTGIGSYKGCKMNCYRRWWY